MPAPRLALVTCSTLPDLDPDDRLLADALRAQGVAVDARVWDDPAVPWGEYELVLLRSPWDYAERLDAFRAFTRAAAEATTLLNPAEVVAWNTDKTYLRRLAREGVPTVPTEWLPRGGAVDLGALLAQRGWREAIVKPTVGAGSSGLLRVHDGDSDGAGAAHLAQLLEAGDAMAQPFVPSLPVEGETSLIYFGGRLSHAVRKQPPAGEFRVQPDFGAVTSTVEPTDAQLAVGEATLATLDEPPLYARVDMVSGDDGAQWLMELELVEPTLYLEPAPGSAERFAALIVDDVLAAAAR